MFVCSVAVAIVAFAGLSKQTPMSGPAASLAPKACVCPICPSCAVYKNDAPVDAIVLHDGTETALSQVVDLAANDTMSKAVLGVELRRIAHLDDMCSRLLTCEAYLARRHWSPTAEEQGPVVEG